MWFFPNDCAEEHLTHLIVEHTRYLPTYPGFDLVIHSRITAQLRRAHRIRNMYSIKYARAHLRPLAPPPPAPLARGCMRALKLSSLQYATRSSGHVRTLAPAVSTPLTRPPPHHVCILMGRRTRPVQDESTHARSSTRRCMRPVTCQRPCCCCCYCCCRRRRHRFPTGRPWRRGRGRR